MHTPKCLNVLNELLYKYGHYKEHCAQIDAQLSVPNDGLNVKLMLTLKQTYRHCLYCWTFRGVQPHSVEYGFYYERKKGSEVASPPM